MTILKNIVLSKTAPNKVNTLWARPIGNGFVFYLFNNGRWSPMKIVDDMGTAWTGDDTLASVSGIEDISQDISAEVSRQLAEHDNTVHDTHNTESGDDNEYADINII